MDDIIHMKDLETPALVINEDKLDENINKMSVYMKSFGCCLRPHFKTHKCPIIAHKQIKAGAIGITCAKLGEAEVLAESGIDNILIANQVVQVSKIKRLADIAKTCNVIVAVDNLINIDDLSVAAQNATSNIGVLIEVDVGMARCGVRNKEEALKLAERISNSPGLSFMGIMGYEGHCMFIENMEERKQKTQEANCLLVSYKHFLEEKGYRVDIVSAGGTGTYEFTSNYPGISEVQAGSYIFMDGKYRIVNNDFENSAFLIATVISRPSRDLVVIDAGIKSMTNEFGIPKVICPDGALIEKMSEEHSTIDLRFSSIILDVGDKVIMIPSHICTTVNLHDKYYVMSNNTLISEWEITARGKSK